MKRTLMHMARALMREALFPQRWWEEALLHSAVLHNGTIAHTLKMNTPHQLLLKKPARKNTFLYLVEEHMFSFIR